MTSKKSEFPKVDCLIELPMLRAKQWIIGITTKVNAHFNKLSIKFQKIIVIVSGLIVALFSVYQLTASLHAEKNLFSIPDQLSHPDASSSKWILASDSLIQVGMMKALDTANTTILCIAINHEGKFLIAKAPASQYYNNEWTIISLDELERIERAYAFIPVSDFTSLPLHRATP